MKNKKGFTLIELLAIIVILAIIAVITVPIILNVIENAKKGAATDSAYGYKDAVNKYYVTELSNNNNLKLEGEYTISDGSLTGKFEGPESQSKTVQILVSGEKPTSGSLTYSNNVLTEGCLIFGDYAVTFNGNATRTIKGECSPSIPTIESCPGCVFAFYTDTKYLKETEGKSRTETTLYSYTDDYTTLNKDYFLGHILDEQRAIERIFVCGIKDEVPFCIEGTSDGSKYLDNKNVLDDPTLWNGTCYYRSGSYNCSGTISVSSGTTGSASVRLNNTSRGCGSNGYTGGWFCYEY